MTFRKLTPGGVRSLTDVYSKCTTMQRSDVVGVCRLWAAGRTRGRPACRVVGADGVPRLQIGQKITAEVLGRKTTDGHCWTSICGDPDCMSKTHLQLVPRSIVLRNAQVNRPAQAKRKRNERIRATRLERGLDCPDWMRQWAIESPQIARDAAHALGVSESFVSRARRMARRQAAIRFADPFAVLVSQACGVPIDPIQQLHPRQLRRWNPAVIGHGPSQEVTA